MYEQKIEETKTMLEILKKVKLGDDTSLMMLIDKFRPIIKKYSRLLNYYTAESDLITEFIVLIRKIPTDKENLQEDNEFIAYIAASMKYCYYKLKKQSIANFCLETPLNDYIVIDCRQIDHDLRICINQLVDKLLDKERLVINSIYYHGYSEAELAKKLGITRQAINKIKNKALKKLLVFINN